MAARAISVSQVDDTDHLARYCGFKKLNPDGSPSPAASLLLTKDFEPHPNLEDPRPFLSTDWLEFFHKQDRGAQIKGVLKALGKKIKVGATSKLAVVNVRDVKVKCAAEGYQVEIKTTGEIDDPSHTGIYGYQHANNEEVAAILALQVDHRLFPTN